MKLICLVFLIFLLISSPLKGEDNETLTIDYPTKAIYQSIIGCYQGTHRWIVMSNPALIGVTPPAGAQQKMTEHCFCVMDLVRKQMTYVEYLSKIFDTSYMGQLWMTNALVCVKDHGTLQGIIILDEDSSDNKTKLILPSAQLDNSTDNSTIIPEENDDSGEKNEGEQETIFQG